MLATAMQAIKGHTKLLESKYDQVNVDDVAKETGAHLTPAQQEDFRLLLHHFTKLFDGDLGCYHGMKMHLDVDQEKKQQLALISEAISYCPCTHGCFQARTRTSS